MPDQETPLERPVQRTVDVTSADVQTLADMGVIEAPPPPTYVGLFVEPDIPPQDPS